MLRNPRGTSRRAFAGRLASCVLGLAMLLAAPGAAMAQDDEDEPIDARMLGYQDERGQPVNVALEGQSTALTWVLFIVLAVIGLGGMFKDAKRTHLD